MLSAILASQTVGENWSDVHKLLIVIRSEINTLYKEINVIRILLAPCDEGLCWDTGMEFYIMMA